MTEDSFELDGRSPKDLLRKEGGASNYVGKK